MEDIFSNWLMAKDHVGRKRLCLSMRASLQTLKPCELNAKVRISDLTDEEVDEAGGIAMNQINQEK